VIDLITVAGVPESPGPRNHRLRLPHHRYDPIDDALLAGVDRARHEEARLGGVAAKPDSPWVTQLARNLVMDLQEERRDVRFLVHDQDTKFTASFDEVFASEDIRVIRRPIRAPNANAVTER
jgi:hypothetical protein